TLGALGLDQFYLAPALVFCGLIAWTCARRADRPGDLFNVWVGMVVESGVLALGLWGISRGLGPALDRLGVRLVAGQATGAAPPRMEAMAQLLTFVGAGIYEEAIFRLGIFSALYWVLKKISPFPLLPVLVAAGVSALLFAAAHHAGPHGEKFDGYVFLFRTVAGIYFAFVFQVRGFGISVGAHAGYDVLVGALV